MRKPKFTLKQDGFFLIDDKYPTRGQISEIITREKEDSTTISYILYVPGAGAYSVEEAHVFETREKFLGAKAAELIESYKHQLDKQEAINGAA